MRKLLKMMLLSALLSVPLATNAQSLSSLTVANGTDVDEYVPIYGYYMDSPQRTQTIYHDSLLTDMRGNYIHQMTFYATNAQPTVFTSTMTVSLGITTANTLGTSFESTAMTPVWSGSITVDNDVMVIVFDSAFAYPTNGGNLLVQFQQTAGSNYMHIFFDGVSTTGNGLRSYSSNSPQLQNFMPKLTFAYGANSDYCRPVRNLAATPTSDVSGTISWTPMGLATNWNVILSDTLVTDFTAAIPSSVADTTYTATGLTADTRYYAYVQSSCGGDDNSAWVGPAAFRTYCDGSVLPVPQIYGFEELTEGELPSCWNAIISHVRNGYNYPSATTQNGYNGNNSFAFISEDGQDELLRLGTYDATSPLMISFYGAHAYAPEQFIVGYMDANNDFVPVDTLVMPTEYYPTEPFAVSFADVSMTALTPAIYVVGDGSSIYASFIDDVRVQEQSACAAPYNFHALNVSGTTIDLQWSDSTGASSWTIVYDTMPITDFANAVNQTAGEDSVTISDLEFNTMYYFYLQSDCSNGGNSEWVGPLTATTQACDDGCYYHISMVDGYGDGWNGGYISYTLNGVLQAPTFTIDNGAIGYDSIYVCNGMTLGLNLNAGSYPDEVSFTLSNMLNEPLYTCSDASTLPAGLPCYVGLASCSNTCPAPNQLAITAINPTELEITWNEQGEASQWNIICTTAPVTNFASHTPEVATSTTYTIQNLDTLTYYYIYVQADCGSEISNWTMIQGRTSLCEGACELTVECNTTSANSWSYGGCAISVMQNGYLISTVSSTSNVPTCPGDSIYFKYSSTSNYYDTYNSWRVYDRYETELINVTTITSDTVATVTDCQAPGCPRPLEFTLSGTSSGVQSLSWREMGEATSWTVAYGTSPMSDSTTLTTVSVTDTSFTTITGLSDDSIYYYYVQADCGDDVSEWTGPLSGRPNVYIMTANCNTYTTLCGGHIYDDGSADGNYSNNQNSYLTVYPADSTMGVAVNGMQWLEGYSNDWIKIYDGVGTNGTLLFSSDGANSNGTNGLAVSAVSLHGPLTIHFRTDGSVIYAGFDLAVSCFDMTCPAIDSLQVTNFTPNSIDLDWVGDEDVSNYIVKWSTSAFTFESTNVDSMLVSTDNAQLINLNANTMYYIGVASDCGSSISNAIFVNLRTACGEITLPYSDDFESYAGESFPSCWTNANGTSFISTYSTATSGSNTLQFRGNGIVLSPRVPLPGNQIQLNCNLRAESTSLSGIMHIGFTTDPFNMSDYVEIQAIQPATSYTTFTEIVFNAAGADTGYVVFKQDPTASAAYYWWLDDVVIEAAPACPSVGNVTATAVDTTSITISWTERGTATSWSVEYGPHGFTAGTGIASTETDTTFSATGLNPGTEYDFIIKPVCVDSVPDRRFSFSTYTLPVSVPFNFDFSDPAQHTSWTRENSANGWYIGEMDGDTILYVSNDNGATNGYINSAACVSYAYIDLILAANEYSYGFNWKANGESNYDYIRVALIPQGTDLSAITYSQVGTTTLPAGWIALDGGNKLNQQSSWQTYGGEIVIPAAGGYHMAFIWRNDGSAGSNPAGAVDDITFMINSCPVVANVHSTSVGTSEIEVDWDDIASNTQGWQIEYGVSGYNRGTGTVINTTSHPVVVSNLDTLTNYDFYVRSICGAGDSSRWSDAVTLGTVFCDDATIVSTGTATSTNSEVPIQNYYNYSLTQTIISAAELEDISEINAISYQLTGSASSTGTDVTIWLQPTGKVEFDSDMDMVPLDTNIAVQVYTGNLDCVPGWNTFVFDTPYTWTGDSTNLLVIVDNNTGVYTTSYYYGSVDDTLYRSICFYDDNSNPDPLDPSSFNGYNTISYMARPAMQLIACGGSSCRKPSGLNATNVDYGNATITWSANGTDYEIAIKAENEGVWPNAIAVSAGSSNASYQFTGLDANTNYQYRVRQVCDATVGDVSDWATASFTTEELPCFAPEGYSVTSTTMSTATINCSEAANATSYEVHVWNTVYDSLYTVSGTTATIGGLSQTSTYNAAIRSVCGHGAEMSEYGDTIQFTTQTCEVPTNANTQSVTANTATITWNGSAANYILEYGMGAFGEGQGTTVEVSGTSYTITSLESETQYSALVRAKCDDANLSGWSSRVVFTTETGVGIDAANGLNVNIYPNPTSSNTTITLSGVNGEVNIAIVDLNGRTVRSEAMSCEGDCAHQLEVSGLASGAYYVRISGEGVNTVKKLIVK